MAIGQREDLAGKVSGTGGSSYPPSARSLMYKSAARQLVTHMQIAHLQFRPLIATRWSGLWNGSCACPVNRQAAQRIAGIGFQNVGGAKARLRDKPQTATDSIPEGCGGNANFRLPILQGQDPRITLRCIAGYLPCGPGTGRLRLNQGQQAGLIEQSDTELAGFVELGAGFGAGDDEVGLLGDRAADFAAGGFDQVFGSIAR
jgi:hypothetical protein